MQTDRVKKSRISKVFYIAVISLVTIPQLASAQNTVQLGLNGLAGFPQGEFKNKINTVGGGLDLECLYAPGHGPFGFGLSGGFMIYGYEKHREIVQTNNADFHVDVSTTNSIFFGHLLFRIQNKYGNIRPYLDGLLGFKYFATITEMDDPDWYDDDDEISQCSYDDTVLSYGGSAGIMLRVYGGSFHRRHRKPEIFIDLRLRYLRGGNAVYLKKGGINRVNGNLVYDVQESETDLLTTHLGVTVSF